MSDAIFALSGPGVFMRIGHSFEPLVRLVVFAAIEAEGGHLVRKNRIILMLACCMPSVALAQTTQPAADPVPQVSPEDIKRSIELNTEGWKIWQQHQFDQAAEVFQQAVELNPTNTNAWNGLGWSRFNSGELDQAEVAFNKVLEIDPKHPAALNGMGQLALMRGKTDEAEKWFLKCSETAPAAWYGLARLYLAQEKWEDAEKWAQKIIDEKQTAGQDEYVQRLLAAAKAKHLDDDLKAQLAPLLGSSVTQDMQRAFRLLQKGQRDEAKEIFEKALEEHPDDPSVLNGVGWYRFQTGEVPAAQQLFEKCLELQPTDIGAMNGLANCFKQQGRVDEAIEMWKQMLEKYPSASSMGWILAETYMERNEFEKALPIWEKLAKEQPENQAVQAGLAKAREGAKK